MSRVKVCGITNIEDAKLVSDLGVDALGLVFFPPSPRYVTIHQAAEVVDSLPPFVTSVALFVNAQRHEVEQVLDQVAIDLIQFHGDESEAFCNSFNRPYIKAIRMQDGIDLYAIQNDFKSAKGLLLDTYKQGIPGGTGEVFNWDKVPHDLSLPIVLAGGLSADNISQAIQQVKPYAVDVSGGVEASKGKKDPEKLTQFMKQLNC